MRLQPIRLIYATALVLLPATAVAACSSSGSSSGPAASAVASQLRGLGLPASIQKIVITGVETGQVPASNSSGAGPAGPAALVQKVIDAAYTAFHDGLRDALFASAALVLVAGLLAVVTLRAGSAEPTDNRGDG